MNCEICTKINCETKHNCDPLTLSFIKKARLKHGLKYSYEKTKINNISDKVIIFCLKHNGEFTQKAYDHIDGNGCFQCSTRRSPTTEEFIKNANLIHNNYYDYSKTEYKTSKTPVIIICPKHGEFNQRPDCHVGRKRGCRYCNKK